VLLLLPALTPALRPLVKDLEHRVVSADGGRLKLEWGVLDSWAGDGSTEQRVAVFAEDGRALGFAGRYAFGDGGTAELAGMVDPGARRRGIGSRILEALVRGCRERGFGEVLLVTPRNGGGGAEFAHAHGGRLDHSEHALVLRRDPTPGRTDPAVTLRRAGPEDVEVVGRLLDAAFHSTPSDLRGLLALPEERTLLISFAGEPVGTVRLTRGPHSGGIYGFAVDPAWQGRGIGRDVLRRCCALLREEGATSVGLEVEVDNERALGLYTSVGFERVLTEDYYALP
jgi:ribosomal protein S18 acetylase RimI-like enzyme